ncbi:TolC family protein [Sulfurimonas autotrophica]|uniref:Outer membrane efflux protein n=1 Tax=Sulfurimonas autotrophica (strain ATCC BAA-671 / DSM 16294 / JCM 11897 / OK10) TaxID=563040 RepID=E0UTY7_SULAO|nr:TolC family protein [Sulfurimonas autotrophica]ADN09431.1 hypothetical protein Saut_1384 [Sulfurimonas autotrophica DSM 16294]
MTKKIILILILSMTLDANIIDFYKKTVTTLQYNQKYELNTKANKLNKSGVVYSKYANFSLNADYSKTKAKRLTNAFDTTNVTFNDTLDLFDKSSYKIDALTLDLKSKKSVLNIQKEQLFISLVNMIALYNKTLEQLSLYKALFNEQEDIYGKLQKLQQKGAITSMDLLRFKNQLTSLEMTIINQENEILKMKKQLNLYAPNQQIPPLKSSKLLYSKEDFLSRNPQLSLNNTDAQKLLVQAKGLERSYLPDVTAGAAYQQLGDPTSYGNNYSFIVGLQIPLNAGNFKEAQALKVKALSLKSQNIQYKIRRKNEYTTRYQDYINAVQQLKVLYKNLDDYEKSEKTIKTAYLRQYVDFNTYMQTLLQTLHVKEQILEIKSKKELEATVLNNIASGIIYE